jgi:type II secretory pathway component PulJ
MHCSWDRHSSSLGVQILLNATGKSHQESLPELSTTYNAEKAHALENTRLQTQQVPYHDNGHVSDVQLTMEVARHTIIASPQQVRSLRGPGKCHSAGTTAPRAEHPWRQKNLQLLLVQGEAANMTSLP